MPLTCKRCGAEVPLPSDTATAAIACPGCGARYVRKPGGATRVPGATAAPLDPQRTPTRELSAAERDAFGTGSFVGPTFATDQLVGGRYRVLRFIAKGGMGEVYEALDLELKAKVALKTIDPRMAESRDVVERFKREILLARRVTHPNVCRIFDVGYHGTAAAQPTIFLTMELLEGRTLSMHLKLAGRMTPEVALPLVRQMAAALEAAHQAGIVHRDFKSENVFLVPGPAGLRAVVTDFGVARAFAGGFDGAHATMTGTPKVIGTPAYMAPEQLEGGDVSPASDQYALGVVIFEMLTGRLPFQGDSPFSTAVKRLTEPAPSPRLLVPELPGRWERTILRCLERRSEARFPNVAAVVDSLAGAPSATIAIPAPAAAAAPTSPPRPRRSPAERRKLWLAAAVGIAFVAVAANSYFRIQRLKAATAALDAPFVARRSVAVLGFLNRTGRSESAWLSPALAEMLSTELGASGDLRVVPGETVARGRMELGLADSDTLSAETLARLRTLVGSDYVVVGSYVALAASGGNQVRLDLRLQDARSGETVVSLGEASAEAQLFELVAATGEKLCGALGVGAAADAPRAWSPASPEAARLYAEGVARLRRFDPAGAREVLEQAVAADPENALAHSALANAWAALGYEGRSAESAERAVRLADRLPKEERRIVEARHAEATRDWPRAAELWGALARAYPDEVEYGLRLSAAELGAGRAVEAQATATALARLPPPAGSDPRIDLAAVSAASALGDFHAAATAAARAVEKGTASGAKLLVAEALVARCWAQHNLGERAPAAAACESATRTYEELGDRAGRARALVTWGALLADGGELVAAEAHYREALVASRELGDEGGAARALNNLAVAAKAQGRRDEARRLYDESLAILERTSDRVGAAYVSNNIGTILLEQGKLAEARSRFERTLAVRRETADQGGIASALHNLGTVLRRSGDLAGATRSLEEALAIRRELGQKPGEAATLAALGLTDLERGELARARGELDTALVLADELGQKSLRARVLHALGEAALAGGELSDARVRHEEALALRREIGEGTVTESELAVAHVDLAENDLEPAEVAARRAIERYDAESATDEATRARALLARVMLARNETGAALTLASAATLAAAESESPAVRIEAELAESAARARGTGTTRARELAGKALAEAESRALPVAGWRAAVAVGRLELALARAARDHETEGARGAERLTTVAREAAAAGYAALAAEAGAASR